MRKYKKLLLIAIVGSFLFSCSTSNNVVSSKLFQKRKYQKGWHVNSTNKIDRVKKAEKTEYEEGLVAQNERVEDEPVQKNERTETKKEVTIQATENKAEVVVNNNNNVEEQNGTKSELKTKKELNNFEAITLEAQRNTNHPIQKEETGSTQSNNSSGYPMLLLIILCIILPPLAVGLVRGWTVKEFIISILLTLLFWLPGVIYALLIIFDMI